MSHRPASCVHFWSSWDPEPRDLGGGIVVYVLRRVCFDCFAIEEWDDRVPVGVGGDLPPDRDPRDA